jgi:PAS domain S-box-containing protein
LQQQLLQFFGPVVPESAEMQAFLASVELAYRAADDDRIQLERNLGITSQQLLARNQQLQRDLAERERAQRALIERSRLKELEADVDRAVTRGGELAGMMQSCVDAIALRLNAPIAALWMFDDEHQVLRLQAWAGADGPLPGDAAPVPLGQLRIGRIAERRQMQTGEEGGDSAAYARRIAVAIPGEPPAPSALPPPDPADRDAYERYWLRRKGLPAFSGYPLVAGLRLLGVLALYDRRPPSEFTLGTLSTLAAAISLGIENARSQQALWESEERFRAFMDHSPAVAFLKDEEGRILWVNRPYERVFGTSLAAIRGKTEAERWPPEVAARLSAENTAVLDAGTSFELHEVMPTPAGPRVMLALKFPFQDSASRRFVGGMSIDITARRQAEEARESSLSVLQATLESTTDGILAVDGEGRALAFNQRFLEMWSIPPEQLAGGDSAAAVALVQQQISGPEAFLDTAFDKEAGSGLVYAKDGRVFEWYSVPQLLGTAVVGHVSSFRDVTMAQRADWALRDSEERYRLLFESNPQPMWVYDLETLAFLAVNRAAESHYGYSRDEFLAMTIKDIRPPEDVDALLEDIAASGALVSHQKRPWRHRTRDGATITVEILSHGLSFSGRPSRLVLVSDITERQRIEEHLRQTQKMEAIGRLAGGVAHDFNNLLTVIAGYASLIGGALPPAGAARAHLDQIQHAAERAAALTQQLLAFSRQQFLQPRALDLNALLRVMQGLLKRILGEDVQIHFSPAPDLGVVQADPGQIEQLVMNLAVNARDAMPCGGKMEMSTANVRLTDDVGADVPTAAGDYVRLTIRDDGVGMDPITRSRAFEPFFTTKEKGKGTGLGLSSVYGVVKQSGGFVWIDSDPGHGCSVNVCLPRIDRATTPATADPADPATPAHPAGPADPPAPPPPPPPSFPTLEAGNDPAAAASTRPAPTAGRERVLVAEDEEAVRSLIVQVLSDHGFRVLPAAGGAEALEICRTQGDIDLLLTDVVMPEVSGPQLVRQVLGLYPAMKVLYMSGYLDKALLAEGALPEHGFALVEKPFLPSVLVRRVREALA